MEQELNHVTYNVFDRLRAVEKEVKDMLKRLDDIDTSVINPWHRELGRISPDINNKLVYGDLADECLTAEQYCKLGLTADQYKAFDITAITYARFGKEKLHYFWVYSPSFGFRQEISNVLTSILNGIMDTLTAEEYSLLNLDADGYDALDLTAWQYYSFMADEGYLKLGGNGITASQYATITV